MKNIEFWILESVVNDDDWDCSRIRIFKSYESLTDYVKARLYEFETTPKFVDVKDPDGYLKIMVYDTEDDQDPWYLIHKGSLVLD